MMGLLGLLLFSCGIFAIGWGCKCVPETGKCSQLWAKIETYKDLMESERELDAWCRKQPRFYDCLESVLLADKNGNMSYLPTNLLISKMFSEDLCTDGSTSRRRYLNNAACINQLNTEFCTEPEYHYIVTPDDAIPPSRCSLSEKTFSCIAATMVLNCGFDAGRVYRNLLKITRYSAEVCDIEKSEGIPPCEESGSKVQEVDREQKTSEIYYGLVHRIGSIPEQGDRAVPIVSNELRESEGDEVVTEAIKIALDSLDQNALIEEHSDEPGKSNLVSDATEESTRVYKQYKPYMKNPIITQIYRDIIFYNYSSLEYAFYWRQPAFTIFENVTCEHLQPSYMRGIIFRCVIEYRTRDPDCVSNATVHEPVTPELIRDIDPEVPDDSIVEFGPRPDWMKDMDDAYEDKRLRDLMKSTTVSSEESPVTDNSVFTTSSTLLHVAEAITKPPEPEWWEVTHTMLLPDDIKAELMDLLMPEPEKYVPPPMNMFQIGNCMYIFIYDPLTNSVENFTCSRLNECHPRGKGVFKCSAMRRKIETCDVCYGGTGADIQGLPVTWPSHPEYPKPAFKVSETTDPTPEPASSGFSELTPSEEELIARVFSDVKSETETSDDDEQIRNEVDAHESTYVDEVPESEPQLIMRSTDPEENSEELEEIESEDAEEDALIRLVILDQNSLQDRGGDSYIPELVYAIDEMEVLDNDNESELTESSDGVYGLLNENVIVLHSLASTDYEESVD